MDIGNRIKSRRIELGLSVDDVAAKIGRNKATVYRYEKGDIQNVSSQVLEPLAKALNTTPAYLLGIPRSEQTNLNDEDINLNITEGVPIPILGEIAAGTPIPAVEDIDVYDTDNYALIGERMAASGTYYGLRIRGASMEPRMFEDDVVIVRQQSMVDSGQIAVVLINGDTATVKQVKFDDNGITLIGFNEDVYPPRHFSIQDVISMPVQIIGRVVEVRGKL